MSHLFDILVFPVAEYANEIWGFMQAEKMERFHVEFCKFTGFPDNISQPGMLWCYVGRVLSLIQWKVSMVNSVSEC